MPRKWIFFQVIAGIAFILSFLNLGEFIVREREVWAVKTTYTGIQLSASLIGLIIILIIPCFIYLCLYLIRVKYPDSGISKGFKRLFFTVYVFYLLALIFETIILIFLSMELSKHGHVLTLKLYGLRAFISLVILVPAMIYIALLSPALMKLIKRNFTESENERINSLGISKLP